jgi:NitT/TauT family transport system substrate-binding protein
MTGMSPELSRLRAGRSSFVTTPAPAGNSARPHAGRSPFPGLFRHGPRSRGLLAGAAAAAAAVAIAACGSSGGTAATAAPKITNITVAAVPSEGAAGLYLAQAKGLFAKAGLHVTIETAVSSATVIPSMLHGSIVLDYGAYTSYIGADAAGVAKLRVIAPGFSLGPHVQEILVSPHSPIKTLADLKGKTIAVNVLNGIAGDLVFSALAAYGITPAQVHLVAVPFPAMSAALASGHVDAIETNEPFVTEAVQQDGARALADVSTGPNQLFPISGYGLLASWAQQHAKAAAALVKALEQGNALAATDLPLLQHVMAAQLHLSPAVTAVMADGTFPTKVDPVQLQRVADLMLRYGQLKSSFKVTPIIGA